MATLRTRSSDLCQTRRIAPCPSPRDSQPRLPSRLPCASSARGPEVARPVPEYHSLSFCPPCISMMSPCSIAQVPDRQPRQEIFSVDAGLVARAGHDDRRTHTPTVRYQVTQGRDGSWCASSTDPRFVFCCSQVCHLPSCMYVLRAGQFQAALTKTSLYRRWMGPRLGTQMETLPEEQVTQ